MAIVKKIGLAAFQHYFHSAGFILGNKGNGDFSQKTAKHARKRGKNTKVYQNREITSLFFEKNTLLRVS